MVLKAAKQKLVTGASLTDIDQAEIVIVENIDSGLLPEIYRYGRGFFGWNALQVPSNFGSTPKHVISPPKQTEIVDQHRHGLCSES